MLSATSGKAGGMTGLERFKAAKPFGQREVPTNRTTATPSLAPRFSGRAGERGFYQRPANPACLVFQNDSAPPLPGPLLHFMEERVDQSSFHGHFYIPGIVKLRQSSGRTGGFLLD